MRSRSIECPPQMYYALFKASVLCNEVDLAVEVFSIMGSHNIQRPAAVYQAFAEMYHTAGQMVNALKVLEQMHREGLAAEVSFYNTLLMAALRVDKPHWVIDIFRKMQAGKVEATSKSYTALVSACTRLGSVEQATNVICSLLASDSGSRPPHCLAALMAACEKAGQWDLAITLFERLVAQGQQPDVTIFNSMIAACAHGGEFQKACELFHKITEHGCQPDAVSYANLIRAYKKGGQWCSAVDVFEVMQGSGRRPHAAVHSSVIDVLWQTGIPWAQRKAVTIFNASVRGGSLPAASETCKKGTLKLDLQALTVGVALLAMTAWLLKTRACLMHDASCLLDSARKLAIVNGLGEHSRAQGHSAVVKEAVFNSLVGCMAPFRLVPDHSRSGRLEAQAIHLRKWLCSDNFQRYLHLMQWMDAFSEMESTAVYLRIENHMSVSCAAKFRELEVLERRHGLVPQVLAELGPALLAHRKHLLQSLYAQARLLGYIHDKVVHTAAALLDRVLTSGGWQLAIASDLESVVVYVLLDLARRQEGLPPPLQNALYFNSIDSVSAAHQLESRISVSLSGDLRAFSPYHFLELYIERLGCNVKNAADVDLVAGEALRLAEEAQQEAIPLPYLPSLAAAAILTSARNSRGLHPAWPSVLAHMTGYSEAGTPFLSTAIAEVSKLAARSPSLADMSVPVYNPAHHQAFRQEELPFMHSGYWRHS
eukprot:jgi/Botrbrau1/10405/Bobra.0133s0014.1